MDSESSTQNQNKLSDSIFEMRIELAELKERLETIEVFLANLINRARAQLSESNAMEKRSSFTNNQKLTYYGLIDRLSDSG